MHANDKPNTTANPNAEGDDLGQVGGEAKEHATIRTTAPNGERNVYVGVCGIRKNDDTNMPKYVRIELSAYPMHAINLMTPDEARTLAKNLIEAANFADTEEKGE
jgi:hypothetical protein